MAACWMKGAACVYQGTAALYAVTTPNGIDEANYVKLGGLEQWITIRGEDRKNPVLLLLHGGPGDATNPWGYAGFRNWLKWCFRSWCAFGLQKPSCDVIDEPV
jgi:hypothetical protein